METTLFIRLSSVPLSYPCGRGLDFSGFLQYFCTFAWERPKWNLPTTGTSKAFRVFRVCWWHLQDSETAQVLWGVNWLHAFEGSEPSNLLNPHCRICQCTSLKGYGRLYKCYAILFSMCSRQADQKGITQE